MALPTTSSISTVTIGTVLDYELGGIPERIFDDVNVNAGEAGDTFESVTVTSSNSNDALSIDPNAISGWTFEDLGGGNGRFVLTSDPNEVMMDVSGLGTSSLTISRASLAFGFTETPGTAVADQLIEAVLFSTTDVAGGDRTLSLELTDTNDAPSSSTTNATVTTAGPVEVFSNGASQGTYATIQDAIDAAHAGDTVIVGDGNYAENVTIDKSLTLQSENGRGSTTIEGISGVGALGSVLIDGGVDNVTVEGFTIIGIDNGAPGVENAGLYLRTGGDASDNIRIVDNEIVAAGDHGMLWEYGAAVTNSTVDGNIFSGQTFTGSQPGGIGFSGQFTDPNVPRQLVTIGNGGGDVASAKVTNLTFTNNEITGTAGGISSDDDVSEQGNTLATIDAAQSLIDSNSFTGDTARFGVALRVRRPETDVTNNSFDNTSGSGTWGTTVQNSAGSEDYSGNTFLGGGDIDVQQGTPGADLMIGGDGDDMIIGNAGNDLIDAGAGADVIYGGDGDDRIMPGPAGTGAGSSGALTGVSAVERVSTSDDGTQANNYSYEPVFSPDGSKVAFSSNASNLVAGDTNAQSDIFVKDLGTGVVTRVSTSENGTEGNNGSSQPVFSPDGSKVAFASNASILVAGDTNGQRDIFVKDLGTGVVTRVSASENGTEGNANSFEPVFSPDGSKVAFSSNASNLVAGDTNGQRDIFVKDLGTGVVTRVSTSENGTEGNANSFDPVFSPDGSKIAFASHASNLVAGDTNARSDIFVKDLGTGVVTRVSTSENGTEGNGNSHEPVFSPDGSKIAFRSLASNLVVGDTNGTWDIFVRDLGTGVVTRVSTSENGTEGNANSLDPVFSPDGTKIAFRSYASNLVTGDTNGAYDIFVKDLVTGAIARVTTSASGVQGNNSDQHHSFSPDGTRLLFSSGSTNLIDGETDANGSTYDIFIADLEFAPSAQGESIDGGAGFDTVDYSAEAGAIAADLTAGTVDREGGAQDQVNNVEGIVGTVFHDSIAGSGADETFEGGAGNDVLSGAAGNDSLGGGTGNDALYGGDDDDILNGGAGNDIFDGGAGTDTARVADSNGNPFNPADYDFSGLTVSGGAISGTMSGPDGTETLSGIEVLEIENTGSSTFVLLPGMSIQAAVNAASAGDVIVLSAGTYTENNITIDKALTIRGDGVGSTILDATGGDGFIITNAGAAAKVIFEDMTIDHASGSGVVANAASTVDKVVVDGVAINNSGTNAVEIRDNGANDVQVLDSTFTNNGSGSSGGDGALSFFQYNNDATIQNVTVTGNGTSTTSGSQTGIQFRGDTGSLGTVTVQNVTVDGSHARQPIGIFNYDDINGLTIDTVTINSDSTAYNVALNIDGVGGMVDLQNETDTNFALFTNSDAPNIAVNGDVIGVQGDATANDLGGSNLADFIRGYGGDDQLRGNLGDDVILGFDRTGAADNDVDTAAFSGSFTDYTITFTSQDLGFGSIPGFQIVGPDGSDFVGQVERLNFDADGTTVLVVGSGGYASLQAAVDAANPGDTILVAPGSYDEVVSIDKPLSILGQGALPGDVCVAGFVVDPAAVQGAGDALNFENLALDPTLSNATNTGLRFNGEFAGNQEGTLTLNGVVNKTDGSGAGYTQTGVIILGGGEDLNVEIVNSSFSGSGANPSNGGSGELVFFEFLGNSTITDVTLSGNTGATPGVSADNGLQISGFQDVAGTGNETTTNRIGTFIIDGLIIDGTYGKTLAVVQGYNDLGGLSFANTTLGSLTSAAGWAALYINQTFAGGNTPPADGMNNVDLSGITFDGGSYTNFGVGGEAGAFINAYVAPEIITATTGDDIIVDQVVGGGDDSIDAGAGKDIIMAGGGNDHVDGGTGIDTAVYAGSRADYTVLTTTDVNGRVTGFVSVSDNNTSDGDEGSDGLISVERLVFQGNDNDPANDVTLDPSDPIQVFDQSGQLTGTFDNLKDAVDSATDGSLVLVDPGSISAGSGQVEVNVDLTIRGAGKTQTTILAQNDTGTSGDARGWFLVADDVTLTVEDIEFDGDGYNIWQAFRHRGDGSFDEVSFTDIKYQESGPAYSGTAIAAFGGGGDVDVSNSMFSDIGRIGVLYFGAGTTGTFQNNMYTGKGDGDFLDYALDISSGAVIDVMDNTISDNRGVASSDGSNSAGILVTTYFGDGTVATLSGNTFTDNSTGVYVGYDQNDTSLVTIGAGNTISGGDNGLVVLGNAKVSGVPDLAGSGATVIWDGGDQDNIISGAGLSDELSGGAGNDSITGLDGGESITGGDGDDTINAGAGADSVDAGAGNDLVIGGTGQDSLGGGDGDDDTVDYSARTENISLDLDSAAFVVLGTGFEFDTLTGFENARTGSGADDVVGSSLDNSLDAGAGNDELTGELGNDELVGGLGLDIADFAGDFADYSFSNINADANEATGTATITGPDGTDSLDGIETATFDDQDRRIFVARTDSETAIEDQSKTFDVLANDFAITGQSLVASSVRLIDSSGNEALTVAVNGGTFSINTTTGEIDFTPDDDFDGAVDAVQYIVADTAGVKSLPANLNVTVTGVNDAPTASGQTVTTDEDVAYTFQASDFGFADPDDSPADGFASVLIDTLPSDGTLKLDGTAITLPAEVSVADINAGKLTYSGDQNFNGSNSFNFRVRDDGGTANGGENTSAQSTLGITVSAVNDAPTVTSNGTEEGDEDTAIAIPVSVSDVDFDEVGGTMSVTVNVTNGKIGSTTSDVDVIESGIGTAQATFTATSIGQLNGVLAGLVLEPDANFNGQSQVSVTADDGGASGSGGAKTGSTTFTVDVDAVNDNPTVAVVASATTAEDTPLAIDINVADLDFAEDANGTFTVEIDVTNGTVQIPIAQNVTGVPANGSTIVLTSDSLADLNTALDSAQFTPDQDFFGTAKIDVTVNDGGSSGAGGGGDVTTSHSIDVTPVNDAPVAGDPVYTQVVDADETFSAQLGSQQFPFSFFGTDVDDTLDATSFSFNDGKYLGSTIGTLAELGVTYDSNTGDFSFDPTATSLYESLDPGDEEDVVVNFKVEDDDGASDTGTVTFTVRGVNDAPVQVGTITNKTVIENDTVSISTAQAFDDPDESDTLVFSATGLPSGLTIDQTTGEITGSVDEATTTTVVVTATDTGGLSTTQTFELTVSNVNDDPTTEGNTISAQEDVDYVFQVADFPFADDDADDVNFDEVELVSLPLEGELLLNGFSVTAGDDISFADIQAGNLIYRTDPNVSPDTSFDFLVRDDEGAASGTETITIEVAPVNDAPVITGGGFDGEVTEFSDANSNENSAVHLEEGSYFFTDIDSSSHTASATEQGTGYLGAMTASVLIPTGTFGPTGVAQWNFVVNDADLESLNEGETLLQDYSVTVIDDQGGSNSETVTITLTGTNDGPEADAVSATTDEDTAVTFDLLGSDADDEDNAESLIYSIVANEVKDGNGTNYFDLVTINGNDLTFDTDADTTGNFDDLDAGETLTLTFEYTVTDAQGATSAPATGTIVIEGTNDNVGETFTGEVQQEVFDGTLGLIDTVDYSSASTATAGLFIMFTGGESAITTGSGGNASGDQFFSIENIVGTAFDDIIFNYQTEAIANTYHGGGGSDLLDGGLGSDELFGGTGDDFLLASDGGATDTVDGGAGLDVVLYSTSSSGIVYDLADPNAATNSGEILQDVLISIEGVAGSSSASNTLLGNEQNNYLVGGGQADSLSGRDGADVLFGVGGDDVIDGGAGIDLIEGGTGTDTLTGGDDRDIFVLQSSAAIDIVTDFDTAEDDLIQFAGTGAGFGDLNFAQVGTDVEVTVDGIAGLLLILEDQTVAIVDDSDNFSFV